jgi:hypothetical protein
MHLEYCKFREEFREFLKTIDLDRYREEFKDKKYVEQDLPNGVVNIMLNSLYENYWQKKNFLSFDTWFEVVWDKIIDLTEFIEFVRYYYYRKLGEDKKWDKWFKEGVKARLYRTWTAILTQFDFSYTVICVKEEKGYNFSFFASPELDKRGVDLQLGISSNYIDFQIYKISERKEAREVRKNIIRVPYPVISRKTLIEKIKSRYVRKKSTYETMLKTFDKYYEELDNGFIVFKKILAEEILKRLPSIPEVEKFVEELANCLRGNECNLFSFFIKLIINFF